MERMVNSVLLEGSIGSVSEFNTSLSKTKRFALCTQEVFMTSGGELVAETYWHNVVACEQDVQEGFDLIKNGATVKVEGRLRNTYYANADGIGKEITEVKAVKVKEI